MEVGLQISRSRAVECVDGCGPVVAVAGARVRRSAGHCLPVQSRGGVVLAIVRERADATALSLMGRRAEG